MTKAVKRLERIHILRTLVQHGPQMTGLEVVERANSECDHELLEDLPEITARGVGQKLNAMALDGLVTGDRAAPYRSGKANPPMLWSVTDKGRELAMSIDEQS